MAADQRDLMGNKDTKGPLMIDQASDSPILFFAELSKDRFPIPQLPK